MSLQPLPLDPGAQRLLKRRWSAVQAAGTAAADDVRDVVRGSWERSLGARVRPDLPVAPVVLQGDELARLAERIDWLALARPLLARQRGYEAAGSVLTLFDREGRMLHGEGDPRTLEGLGAINFRPGALWAEAAVGTNGPGTALATGAPAHIVGAEHFCEGWQGWHCAAAPFRDPLTGRVEGAVDLSGFVASAHPHSLALVVAVAVAIEQALAAREAERRMRILRHFAEAAGRWPGDAVVAVDRAGNVVGASPGAPAALHPLAPLSGPLRASLARAVEACGDGAPWDLALPQAGPVRATVHPVADERGTVGACLVLPPPARRHEARAISPRPGRSGRTPSARYSLDDVVGDAPTLREARRIAVAAAANTLPVLVLGESGTGKEMFAQGIHAASARAAGPFVAVNCGALPAELVESELFGYVGGAFSGARREGSIGKFQAAHGGTLFLDEVGELPLSAQAALLRVLQDHEVTRVGATRGAPVDVRVVAATNRDPATALRDGTLREDLYYRISVLTLELPPLRERRTDVARLAEHLLAAAQAELERPGHRFAPEALDAFRAYPWPGNVREMKNVVWRAVALSTGPVIGLADLPAPLRAAVGAAPGPAPAAAPAPADDPGWGRERDRLARAVESAGSMARAAQVLGIGRSTLYRRMEKYGLQPARVVRESEPA